MFFVLFPHSEDQIFDVICENWLIIVTIVSMISLSTLDKDILFCIDELVKISQVTAQVSTSLRLEEEEGLCVCSSWVKAI